METPSADVCTATWDIVKAEEEDAFAASVDADACTTSSDRWKALVHSWNALVAEPVSSSSFVLATALEASTVWSEAPVKASAEAVARRRLLHLLRTHRALCKFCIPKVR
jgi:hypothetical protein